MKQIFRVALFAGGVAAALLLAIAAKAAVSRISTGAVDAVQIVRGQDSPKINSTAYLAVPGAHVSITVPPAQKKAVLLARFNALSSCWNTTTLDEDYCLVRISAQNDKTHELIDFEPEDPGDFAFDSTNSGTEASDTFEPHATDRSIVLGPGSYTVRVEYAVFATGTNFRLQLWHLMVMKAPAEK